MQPPLIFGKTWNQHFSQLAGWVCNSLRLHFKFQLGLDFWFVSILKSPFLPSIRHLQDEGLSTFRFSLLWGQQQRQYWITLKISEPSHSGIGPAGGIFWCTTRIWYKYVSYIFQQIRVKLSICHTVGWLLNWAQKLKSQFLLFSTESCLSSKTLYRHLRKS